MNVRESEGTHSDEQLFLFLKFCLVIKNNKKTIIIIIIIMNRRIKLSIAIMIENMTVSMIRAVVITITITSAITIIIKPEHPTFSNRTDMCAK